jgi:hypothetical protein
MIEVRVDGVALVVETRADTAITAALKAKQKRPDQEASLHDLRFDRCWIVEPGAVLRPREYPLRSGGY